MSLSGAVMQLHETDPCVSMRSSSVTRVVVLTAPDIVVNTVHVYSDTVVSVIIPKSDDSK